MRSVTSAQRSAWHHPMTVRSMPQIARTGVHAAFRTVPRRASDASTTASGRPAQTARLARAMSERFDIRERDGG